MAHPTHFLHAPPPLLPAQPQLLDALLLSSVRKRSRSCTQLASTPAHLAGHYQKVCKVMTSPHLVLLLLLPAVAVITLGVGFHGHAGEEVLHGVVAQIITDSSKLQQIPERQLAGTHLNAFGFGTFTRLGFH